MPTGDQVLMTIARCFSESSRESDIVGRVGGDEFLIALPDTSARGALRYCLRLLRRIGEAREAWDWAGPGLPTVSLGVAVFPENGFDIDELVRICGPGDVHRQGGGWEPCLDRRFGGLVPPAAARRHGHARLAGLPLLGVAARRDRPDVDDFVVVHHVEDVVEVDRRVDVRGPERDGVSRSQR
jgi:hypothetical protein